MADPRVHPEQDGEHDGASPSEQLIEAARRNNTELLQEVIDSIGDAEKAAVLLNETKTVLGNYLYHEAASRGNYEIIDLLLDQEGFECDPISRTEGDTPLHSAIRYINSLPPSPAVSSFATELITMMTEAGNDPRLKNKANLTPYQLTDPSNVALRQQLQDAVDMVLMRGDFVDQDEGGAGDAGEEDLPEGYEGSASDSDEAEEFRREVERKRGEKKKLQEGGMGQAF